MMKTHHSINLFLIVSFCLNFYSSVSFSQNKDFKIILQQGHTKGIECMAMDPNGKFFVTGSKDRFIKVWSIRGKLIQTLAGHTSHIESVKISPDGKIIVSKDADDVIMFWDNDGQEFIYRNSKGLSDIAFLEGKNQILEARGSDWFVYDSLTEKTINEFLWTFDIEHIEGSRDEKFVMTCHLISDGRIKLYVTSLIDGTTSNAAYLEELSGSWYQYLKAGISRDSKKVFVSHETEGIKIYDIELNALHTIKDESAYQTFAISDNPKLLYTMSCTRTSYVENKLRVVDTESFQIVNEFDVGLDADYFLISPDGSTYVVGYQSGEIKLFNSDGQLIQTIDKGVNKRLQSIAIDDVNQRVILSRMSIDHGNTDGYISIWGLDGKLISNFSKHKSFYSMALTPDSRYLVTGSMNNTTHTVDVWDIEKEKIIKTIRTDQSDGSTRKNMEVALSPDGKFIYSLIDRDHKIFQVHTFNGELITEIDDILPDRRMLEFPKIAVALNGELIAISSFESLQICDQYGKQLQKIDLGFNTSITDVAFSNDSKQVLTSHGTLKNKVTAWSVTGKKIKEWNLGDRDFNNDGEILSIAFSPVEDSFVTGSGDIWSNLSVDDASVRFWSLNDTIKATKEIKNKSYSVRDITFSRNGKYLASTGDEGNVTLWNLENNEKVHFIHEGKEWVSYNEEGYFSASPNGGQLVNVSKGKNVWAMDQFALTYNRPDILLSKLALPLPDQIRHFAYQHSKRLKKADVTAGVESFTNIPKVMIKNQQRNGDLLTVNFECSDEVYELKQYQIYINDVPIFKQGGKKIQGDMTTFNEQIQLLRGVNKIEISTTNIQAMESFREVIVVDNQSTYESDLYFIGFGVTNYQDEQLNLEYAAKDVLDLEKAFLKMRKTSSRKNTKGKFTNVYTKTFTDENVTTENILEAKKILQNATIHDTFVLFIAGHGLHDDDANSTYYFLTHDSDLNNLESTAANFELIEGLLHDIKPLKKVFFMDTCESGELDENEQDQYIVDTPLLASRGFKNKSGNGTKGNLPRKYLYDKDRYIYNDLQRRSGAIVFSSSRGGELSYESGTIENGFFTETILQSLSSESADTNNDRLISMDELRDFVSKEVPKATQGLQHPTVDRDNIYLKFEFPMIK